MTYMRYGPPSGQIQTGGGPTQGRAFMDNPRGFFHNLANRSARDIQAMLPYRRPDLGQISGMLPSMPLSQQTNRGAMGNLQMNRQAMQPPNDRLLAMGQRRSGGEGGY